MTNETRVTYTEDEAIKAVEYVRKAQMRALRARTELKLLVAKAKAAGIVVSKKEIDDYIESHK